MPGTPEIYAVFSLRKLWEDLSQHHGGREWEVWGQGIVRDQVVPVLVLLQAAKGHLGAGDVLFGVLEVRELESGG